MSQSTNPTPTSSEVPLSVQPLLSEQWIAAPIDAVFDFLVDRAKLARWLGDFDAAPTTGAAYRATINDEHVAIGEFLEIDPPNSVRFSFGWQTVEEVPPGSTTVTISLSEVDDGTHVLLQHDGLPLGPEDMHAEGWRDCLLRLVDAVGSAT